jgi:hypothetical protein
MYNLITNCLHTKFKLAIFTKIKRFSIFFKENLNFRNFSN